MIRIDRGTREPPSSLDAPYGRGVQPPKLKGKTERQTVIQRIEEHRKRVAAGTAQSSAFKFPYTRYGENAVRDVLQELFHGKCAYCESRYAGTQPMDVEHWRPKGEVKREGEEDLKPGYYWLASEWTNLLPSCIDCNRARTQYDAFSATNLTLGKKNQFPVKENRHVTKHEDDLDNTGGDEEVLLINPCLEDPEPLLRYDEKGVILPASMHDQSDEYMRAMESIRVYALNRAELVADRLAMIQMVDHRLRLIGRLGEIRNDLAQKGAHRAAEGIADVIAGEIDVLLLMTRSERPFAGLMRQLLRDLSP